ncbi:MAG TPA: RNA methyltransferase [Candidatus Aquilonibacter sp.]|nr:RNA methyltransferase [Candidatus Aquilonibacter sp.]
MSLPPAITSRTNAKVKALRAAFAGKASQPGELVAIEGETLLLEAIRSGIQLETIFLRHGSENLLRRTELQPLRGVPVTVLSRDVFESAVDTASPQGAAATFAIPQMQRRPDRHGKGSRLILESIQDPGNIGTMLRAAEAFGADEVLLTGDTVNPWSPKAIRASAGSVFRTPVRRAPLNEIATWAAQHKISLYAAVAQARGAVACIDADLARPCAIMIGNEGAGLSDAALSIAGQRLHIPCITESLNAAAAAATLLYEAMRQRLALTIPAEESR